MQIRKRVGSSGSLMLPKALRRELGFMDNTYIDIELDDDRNIVLKKIKSKCEYCGCDNKLVDIFEYKLCKSCLDKAMDFIKKEKERVEVSDN